MHRVHRGCRVDPRLIDTLPNARQGVDMTNGLVRITPVIRFGDHLPSADVGLATPDDGTGSPGKRPERNQSRRRRSQLAMGEDVRERSDGKLREPPMEVCRHEGQIDAVHRDGRTNLTGTIRLDGSEHGRKEVQDRARNVPGPDRALRRPLQPCGKLVERQILRATDFKRRATR